MGSSAVSGLGQRGHQNREQEQQPARKETDKKTKNRKSHLKS